MKVRLVETFSARTVTRRMWQAFNLGVAKRRKDFVERSKNDGVICRERMLTLGDLQLSGISYKRLLTTFYVQCSQHRKLCREVDKFGAINLEINAAAL